MDNQQENNSTSSRSMTIAEIDKILADPKFITFSKQDLKLQNLENRVEDSYRSPEDYDEILENEYYDYLHTVMDRFLASRG